MLPLAPCTSYFVGVSRAFYQGSVEDEDEVPLASAWVTAVCEDSSMKPGDGKFMGTSLLAALLICSSICGMTIQIGSGASDLVVPADIWKFFRGTQAPSDPPDAWQKTDFDDAAWESGPAGFGYGDNDDATVLEDMEDSYLAVYLRRTFLVPQLSADTPIELIVDYDDGFIAYLNGNEVARRHMPDGPADYETTASSHEAGTPAVIEIGTAGDLLSEGMNLLVIEGHNVSSDSSDFSLIPALRTGGDSPVRIGETWVVETQTVKLTGTTGTAEVASVEVAGVSADLDPATGVWSADITLAPGLNKITAEAADPQANVLDSGSIDILYIASTSHISGQLTEDTTWSGAVVIEGDVTVPADVALTVEPGTMVMMQDDVTIVVYGQLLADGTENQPIYFTHYAAGMNWKYIMFVDANDSRLNHCIIDYADSEGDHKDYYDNDCDDNTPLPPRTYHEAIVVLACHIDILNCAFQNLPDEGTRGEGDAIAIISDDPENPGPATAHIAGCSFIGIGQAVHTRFSYVLVEDCYFTGHNGDNDDIDLYGESKPAPLIRNNIMIDPHHDDMINPTRCSAILIGNIIAGCDDHGIVLRDRCHPILINNIIYDCSSAGIAVQNQCDALLVNNTIVDCGRGIRFFDHTGRWGPPYCLYPGSGKATLVNCIIWDCPTSMDLDDSPYEQDRGSHIMLINCNIEGGQSAASVSANSTATWGDGNIDVDPLFADIGNGDLHLKSEAGRWDPATQTWVTDNVTSPCIDAGIAYTVDDPNYYYAGTINHRGELWPHGGVINMGAYGSTPQASMSLNAEAGNLADLDYDDSVGLPDFALLAGQWLLEQGLMPEDADRNGIVNFADLALIGQHWLWQQQ